MKWFEQRDVVKIDGDLLEAGRGQFVEGCYSAEQVWVLGRRLSMEWPIGEDWKSRVIGKRVSEETVLKFLGLEKYS